MTVKELMELLMNLPKDIPLSTPVEIEVGGDGAIHSSSINSHYIQRCPDLVVISGER